MVGTVVFLCGLLLSGFLDVRYRRLPNWLTVPLAVAGLAVAGYRGGVQEVLLHVAALTVLLMIFGAIYSIGVCRGGDVKFSAAVGAWMVMGNLPLFLFGWVVMNGLSLFWMSMKKHRFSVQAVWTEQREGVKGAITWLKGLSAGAAIAPPVSVSCSGTYHVPGALAIAGSAVLVLFLTH